MAFQEAEEKSKAALKPLQTEWLALREKLNRAKIRAEIESEMAG